MAKNLDRKTADQEMMSRAISRTLQEVLAKTGLQINKAAETLQSLISQKPTSQLQIQAGPEICTHVKLDSIPPRVT